jgi:hypothetical protein
VRVLRLCWLGIPTEEYEPTVELFRDVLGLAVEFEEPGTAELATQRDDRVQIFAPEHEYTEVTKAPVVIFEVDDLSAARTELEGARIELVGEIGRDENWEWLNFRAPDGRLYALGARLRPQQPT